jgi:integrase
MASIRKLDTGKYYAEIRRKGYPATSKTFATKLEAQAWAVEQEQRMGKHQHLLSHKTLGEAFERYRLEVTPSKKGARWEDVRLKKLQRADIALLPISEVTTDAIQQWIETQKATLAPASIHRELNLISAVFGTARREWKWIDRSPVTDVRKPRKPPPRDRLISDHEKTRILQALDYQEDVLITTHRHQIAIAFLLAIETAMRQGELWGLEWKDVHLTERYVTLHDTKNGTRRNVALSRRAVTLLEKVMLCTGSTGRVLVCNQESSGVIFRRALTLAGIEGMTFHDTRHHAITHLARKLQPLELARMVGHKDIRQLLTYYNETASEIAKRLD